jgi:hypothetical protein
MGGSGVITPAGAWGPSALETTAAKEAKKRIVCGGKHLGCPISGQEKDYSAD